VRGDGWTPGGEWYRSARLREEAARGLSDTEDLWAAGAFDVDLAVGEAHLLTATAERVDPVCPADEIVSRARSRARGLVLAAADTTDNETSLLVIAADQFITHVDGSPGVIAGYPWFGAWSRDTMTSYEGLFICTRRFDEGRALLIRAAETVSQGMLANTADTGTLEYNTADASLWFLHAVGRHLGVTDDDSLAESVADAVDEIVERHIAGTRYGIGMDPVDSLLVQGVDGVALTWMDARIEGRPVTPRTGKAVEINALWINGLRVAADLRRRLGRSHELWDELADTASLSFLAQFVRPDGLGLFDVVDGPGLDWSIRPNQLLAASLPWGPGAPRSTVEVCRDHLLTPIGMRSLSPDDDAYTGAHRGGPHERDAAYHQGTVWPWLLGPYVDAAIAHGIAVEGLDDVDALGLHLREWGLGSVSETADGRQPHLATGCPFQAWSVAEALRLRRRTP
jgi:predicted glycogen debranching enzyme